jgi:hypothetical protein
MQTCVKILEFTFFFKFEIISHVTDALHVFESTWWWPCRLKHAVRQRCEELFKMKKEEEVNFKILIQICVWDGELQVIVTKSYFL